MLKDSYSHYILGISADNCESSICLIKNQKVIAISQERLFSRKKTDKNFVEISLKNILQKEKISLSDIEFIVFFDKPFKKIKTILKSILSNNIKGLSDFIFYDFIQIVQSIFKRRNLLKKLVKVQQELLSIKHQKISAKKSYVQISSKILFTQANFAICAGCFYTSNFRESAILAFNDSQFQQAITIAHGNKNKIDFLKEIDFPHSLSLFRKAIINFFDQKIPNNLLIKTDHKDIAIEIYNLLKKLIEIKRDGSFNINLIYFRVSRGNLIGNQEFTKLFQSIIKDIFDKESFFYELNIALEKLILEIVELLLKNVKKITNSKNLLINESEIITLPIIEKIRQMHIFEEVEFIQHGIGNLEALGCALLTYHQYLKQGRQIIDKKLALNSSSLNFPLVNSPLANFKDILSVLRLRYLEFDDEMQIVNIVSQNLNQGLIIAWHRGYVELGNVVLSSPLTIFSGKYSENNFLKIKNFYEINYSKNQLLGVIFLRDNHLDYFVGNFTNILNDYKNLKLNKDYFNFIRKRRFNKNKREKNHDFIKNNFKPESQHELFFIKTNDANDDIVFYQMMKKFYNLTNIEFIFTLPLSLKNEMLAFDVIDSNRCFKNSDIDILLIKNFAIFKEDQDF